MPTKLGEAEIAAIRRGHAAGKSKRELAEAFGTTPQYVGKLVRGEARPLVGALDVLAGSADTVTSVRGYLERLELVGTGHVRAEIALALAEKLDAVRASESMAAAAAAPGIARQLVDVVDELSGRERELDAIDELRARRAARLLAARRERAAD